MRHLFKVFAFISARNVDNFFKKMGNWDKHKSIMNEQLGQAQNTDNTVFNGKQVRIVK